MLVVNMFVYVFTFVGLDAHMYTCMQLEAEDWHWVGCL